MITIRGQGYNDIAPSEQRVYRWLCDNGFKVYGINSYSETPPMEWHTAFCVEKDNEKGTFIFDRLDAIVHETLEQQLEKFAKHFAHLIEDRDTLYDTFFAGLAEIGVAL